MGNCGSLDILVEKFIVPEVKEQLIAEGYLSDVVKEGRFVIQANAGFRMYYTESGPALDYRSSPAQRLEGAR